MSTTPSDHKASAQVEAQRAEAEGVNRKVTFEFEGDEYTVDGDAITIRVQREIEKGHHVLSLEAILGPVQFDKMIDKPLGAYFRFMEKMNEEIGLKN
jgi:hypothetical protein